MARLELSGSRYVPAVIKFEDNKVNEIYDIYEPRRIDIEPIAIYHTDSFEPAEIIPRYQILYPQRLFEWEMSQKNKPKKTKNWWWRE